MLLQGISYILKGVPDDIPRRLSIPNTWEENRTWKSARDLDQVDAWLIAASTIPGMIIAVLYYFDHNISSKMAQQKDYHLKKPPAYHYDFLLLAFMTILCGLLGLPPANGAIPQSPMHTKSLASLKRQLKKQSIKKEIKVQKSRSTTNLHTLNETEVDSTNSIAMHKAKSAHDFFQLEQKGSQKASSSSSSQKEQPVETAVEVWFSTSTSSPFWFLGQRTKAHKFNSINFGRSVFRGDTHSSRNSEICTLGLFCVHGIDQSAFERILGSNSVVIHRQETSNSFA